MTLVSSGSSTLLSESRSASIPNTQALQIDATSHGFSTQVTGAEGLLGMTAAGLVGRGLRALTFVSASTALGTSSLALAGARSAAFALGLAGESAAFTGTGRLWHQQGLEGFGRDWLHSMISLGSLRAAGVVSAGQNIIVQRALNSSVMVGANQGAAALGIIDRPHEDLGTQFAQALVMDIQCSFTRSLIEVGLRPLAQMERSLDSRYATATAIQAPQTRTGARVLDRVSTLLPRVAVAASSLGALLLKAAEVKAQPVQGGVVETATSVLNVASQGAWALGGLGLGTLLGGAVGYFGVKPGTRFRNGAISLLTLGGALAGAQFGGLIAGSLLGAALGYVGPTLKGKYKAGAASLLAVGGALLAARLGTHFSSLAECAGNVSFLGLGLLGGLAHEAWLQHRIHDEKRIEHWQHDEPRETYVRTHTLEWTGEEYRAVLDAPPVEIDPRDGSWSHETFETRDSTTLTTGSLGMTVFHRTPVVERDVDGYPTRFVRFLHNAVAKSAGFLNGNYAYNRIFHGQKLTALIESAVSTLPLPRLFEGFRSIPIGSLPQGVLNLGAMRGLHRFWSEMQGKTLKEYLIAKFNVAHPERFGWDDLADFGRFFTRKLVTPPEGLPVVEGATFHDGVLDVVGRMSLEEGIRIAGKGEVERRWNAEKAEYENVVGDAVLPLGKMLGRAALRFAGEIVTVIATYLSPRHWHQTLCPVNGTVVDIQIINGKLHSVDPGIRHVTADENFDGKSGSYFQSENSRVIITIDSPEYGPVAVICTAAALVSTSRVFAKKGQKVRAGELLHEYRWGSHNTIVMLARNTVLAPGLVPGRQVYVRGTKPEGEEGIEFLFAPRRHARPPKPDGSDMGYIDIPL